MSGREKMSELLSMLDSMLEVDVDQDVVNSMVLQCFLVRHRSSCKQHPKEQQERPTLWWLDISLFSSVISNTLNFHSGNHERH